jgi:hypothetical protein
MMNVNRWKKEVMEKEFQRERWLAVGTRIQITGSK